MSLSITYQLTFFTDWMDHQDPAELSFVYVATCRRWDCDPENDSDGHSFVLTEEESRRVLDVDALFGILKDREPENRQSRRGTGAARVLTPRRLSFLPLELYRDGEELRRIRTSAGLPSRLGSSRR